MNLMEDQIFSVYYCSGSDQFVIVTSACTYIGPLSGLPEVFKKIEEEFGVFYIDFPWSAANENRRYEPVSLNSRPLVRDAYACRHE